MKIAILLYAVGIIAMACGDRPPKKASNTTVETASYSGGFYGVYTRILTDTKTGRRFLITEGQPPLEIQNTKP